MRIAGLVRLMGEVRARLAAPLDAAQAAALAELVAGSLAAVDRALAARRASLAALPEPSRQAYAWLAALEIPPQPGPSASPVRRTRSADGRTPAAPHRVRGLAASVDSFLNQLAAAASETERARFLAEAGSWLSRVHAGLARRGRTAADLDSKQQRLLRRMEAWMEETPLARFPANAARFAETLEERWLAAFPRGDEPAAFWTASDTHLWDLRPDPAGGHVVRVSDLFLLSPRAALLDELAGAIVAAARRVRGPRAGLTRWLASPEVLAFRRRVEDGVDHDPAAARGLVYDLGELFARLNTQWFAGALAVGRLAWTRSQARCRTGYCLPVTREIFISGALDSIVVPSYVVEYVLYHEMLHLADADELALGRRRAHGAAFRERERRFPRWREAEAFLRRLAAGRVF